LKDIPDQWAKQLPKQEYVERLENQNEQYKNKIRELEQRVEHLRVSRRVLMNLLEKVEREKVAFESLLKRRRNKKERSMNPFEVVIDNSKMFYIHLDESVDEEERNLTYNPEMIFKEFDLEEN
jgi:DNA repair exonuclease SbcCD ATPase subunit